MPPARKLRIVTVLDSLWVGGAERLAVQVAKSIDPARFESVVWVTRGIEHSRNRMLQAELNEAGIPLHVLERNSRNDLLAWRRFASFIRRRRTDVIHAHGFGSNFWSTVVGRAAGAPVVVAHEHSWSFEGEPLRRFLDREVIARGADIFVAVSAEDRRRMIEIERIDPERIRVIPNGIAPPQPSGLDIRTELSIPAEAPVVTIVSMLRPEKAVEVLVEASLLLRKEFPDLRVLVLGLAPKASRLPEFSSRLGLDGTVLFLGLRRDVADVLEATDATVMCSDREGTPLAVVEYMAAAKPVVATRVGGLPDLIRDGENGFLVPPRDPPALADALAKLLRDRELRVQMGERGRERQRAEFDHDTMIEKIEELYEELFARSRRGRREGWAPN